MLLKEIRELLKIYDTNDCECVDDNEPPYVRCKACTAAHALNEIGGIARDALKELNNATKQEETS